jgi:hypothetical protein
VLAGLTGARELDIEPPANYQQPERDLVAEFNIYIMPI